MRIRSAEANSNKDGSSPTLCQPQSGLRANAPRICHGFSGQTAPPTSNARETGDCACAPDAVEPRPFLKWAGGKRQIVHELASHVPADYRTYHEPFLGGGALFFAVRPRRAALADNNLRLVRTWRAIRDDVEQVITLLRTYPHNRDFYLELRKKDVDAESDVMVAAWLLYLNKTAYNGLYRVNRRNQFNVPFGRYANPTICPTDNLRACSRALQGAEISHSDFTAVLERSRSGDFVYFDPPYAPLSATSYFTSYTAEGFGGKDQTRLRDVASELKARRVTVLLSNSNSEFVRNLYSEGFVIREVMASRSVNCRADKRGKIAELLIR